PDLRRIAAVGDAAEAARFRRLGVDVVIDTANPPGVDLAAYVLAAMGIDAERIAAWRARTGERGGAPPDGTLELGARYETVFQAPNATSATPIRSGVKALSQRWS